MPPGRQILFQTKMSDKHRRDPELSGPIWGRAAHNAPFGIQDGLSATPRPAREFVRSSLAHDRIGVGAINVLTQVMVSDLVPLAERGGYLALTFGCVGLVQHTTWRWVFYLNLPIGGFTLVLLFLFLRVNYSREKTLATKLTKIDWAGNAIFIASVTSIVCVPSPSPSPFPTSFSFLELPLDRLQSLSICKPTNGFSRW